MTAHSSSYVAVASSSLPLIQGKTPLNFAPAAAALKLVAVKDQASAPTAAPAIAFAVPPLPQDPHPFNLGNPVATTPSGAISTSSAISQSVKVSPNVACGTGWTPIGYQTNMEPVSELHAYLDQSVQGQYVNTANSDFNAGFAPSGGGWSASGTYHIGNSGSFGVTTPSYAAPWSPPYAFGYWFYAQFQYVEEQETQICGGQSRVVGYGIFPLTWQGGGLVGGPDVSSWDGYYGNGQGAQYQIPRGYFSQFGPGFVASKSTARAYNYGGSIGAFGVGLGGSSGYSTNMQLTWRMGTSFSGYYLFGHDGAPPNATIVYSW